MNVIKADEIGNWEIFVWALHQLGGASESIDVEDVFRKMFDIAPKRFSWCTRIDLPHYQICYKALLHAESKRPSMLIKSDKGHSRRLTADGQKWVKQNRVRLAKFLESGQTIQETKQRPRSRLLTAIERSDVFQEWAQDGKITETKWRVAEILQCSPDSSTNIWRHRIERLRSAAYSSEKNSILSFLDSIMTSHPDWFNGGENESKKR